MSRTSQRILGWGLLLAVLTVSGAWNWRIRSEAEMRLRGAEALESQGRQLQSNVAAIERQRRVLEESLKALSNRLVEVEGLLEAEKTTHEPLRRQIEKMLAEQIAFKDGQELKDKVIKELRDSLAEGGQKNTDLKAQTQTQQERIVKLEADVRTTSEREAAARAKEAEHRAGAADARTKLAEVQARLDDTLRRLDASERAVAELKKAQQAPSPAIGTNAPAHGSTGSSAP